MPDEKLGIDSLEKVIDAASEGFNVVYKMANGAGIFSAFALTDEVSALGTIPKGSVLAQLKDLDQEERAKLRLRFKNKVSIENKELEAQIEGYADDLEEVISIAYEQYDLFLKEKALVEKIYSKFKPKQ